MLKQTFMMSWSASGRLAVQWASTQFYILNQARRYGGGGGELHYFIYYFFYFACQLRSQSCTLMMYPVPHYVNFARNFFQVGMCQSWEPPPPPPLSNLFQDWRRILRTLSGLMKLLYTYLKERLVSTTNIPFHIQVVPRKSWMECCPSQGVVSEYH